MIIFSRMKISTDSQLRERERESVSIMAYSNLLTIVLVSLISYQLVNCASDSIHCYMCSTLDGIYFSEYSNKTVSVDSTQVCSDPFNPNEPMNHRVMFERRISCSALYPARSRDTIDTRACFKVVGYVVSSSASGQIGPVNKPASGQEIASNNGQTIGKKMVTIRGCFNQAMTRKFIVSSRITVTDGKRRNPSNLTLNGIVYFCSDNTCNSENQIRPKIMLISVIMSVSIFMSIN